MPFNLSRIFVFPGYPVSGPHCSQAIFEKSYSGIFVEGTENLKIAKIEQLDDSQNNTFAFVAHHVSNGFVLISPSKSLEPIIAYSLNHSWNPDTSKTNVFYQMLKTDLSLRLKYLDELPPAVKEKNKRLWQSYLGEIEINKNFQQWPGPGTTPTGGWLHTTWTQESPYNDLCPINPLNNQRCLTGCGATAIAQIVNYHKSFGGKRFSPADQYSQNNPEIYLDADSTKLDFVSFNKLNQYLDAVENKYKNNLPLDDPDKAAISFACGLMTNTTYSSSGSATFSNEVEDAFLHKMNYSSADLTNPSDNLYAKLQQNMQAALPAQISILNGSGGHAIVCDGYNTDGFYHINFGWGANFPNTITDAWYSLPQGLPYNYSFILNAVVNIKPGPDQVLRLIASDSILTFQPVLAGTTSKIKYWGLQNPSSNAVKIEKIALPEHFTASLGGKSFTNQIGPLTFPSESELTLQIQFTPDSLGKFRGEMNVEISSGTLRRFLEIDLLGFGAPSKGTAITDKSISGVWSKQNSPYYIVDHVKIAGNETLVIEPGTEVLALNRCLFEIGPDAQLVAKGTETDSIRFSAANPVYGWEGLSFVNSGKDDSLAFCAFTHGKTQITNGGAISLESSSPVIQYSAFYKNHSSAGGVLYSFNSLPKIENSNFTQNDGQSGGVFYLFESSPIIKNCVFEYNSASRGGAVYSRASDFTLCKSQFNYNHANLDGGVLFSTGSNIIVKNCILNFNSAYKTGGLLACKGSRLFFQNITAVNFSAPTFEDFISLVGTSNVEVKNSILWQNPLNARTFKSETHNDQTAAKNPVTDTLKFLYNNIDSVLAKKILTEVSPFALDWGRTNMSTNPLFANSAQNDFTLQSTSPCIDAGDPGDDVGAEPFPHGYRRNLGAYGGSEDAVPTPGPLLTLFPDPIDFGEVRTHGSQEKTIHIKNGSLYDLHITSMAISDSTNFKVLDYEGERLLKSGAIDSFVIHFHPPPVDEQRFDPILSINMSYAGKKHIPLYAHLLTGTPIQGNISGVITKENSPYIVKGDLEVPSGQSLFIEPGVHFKFYGPFRFRVPENAQLRAMGSVEDTIRFSAVHPATGWLGIRLINSQSDDTLAYCSIRDVNVFDEVYGTTGYAFSSTTSNPVVMNSRFNNNHGSYVIACDGDILNMDYYTRISHCCIENNSAFRTMSVFFSSATIENTIFSKNSTDRYMFFFAGARVGILNLLNLTVSENMAERYLFHFSSSYEYQESVFIKNSIFWDNFSGRDATFTASNAVVSFEYCNIDTTAEKWFEDRERPNSPYSPLGFYDWGAGNLCQYPKFTNRETGDLTLSPNSPCIDTGDPDPIFSDIEDPANPGYALWPAMGTVRNDMGAFGGGAFDYLTKVENEPDIEIPRKYKLEQNYPNPFNASTTIEFSIPQKERVVLKIYNIAGQLVDTIVDKNLLAGEHRILYNTRKLAGGMYLYVLEAGEFRDIKKMIYLR